MYSVDYVILCSFIFPLKRDIDGTFFIVPGGSLSREITETACRGSNYALLIGKSASSLNICSVII